MKPLLFFFCAFFAVPSWGADAAGLMSWEEVMRAVVGSSADAPDPTPRELALYRRLKAFSVHWEEGEEEMGAIPDNEEEDDGMLDNVWGYAALLDGVTENYGNSDLSGDKKDEKACGLVESFFTRVTLDLGDGNTFKPFVEEKEGDPGSDSRIWLVLSLAVSAQAKDKVNGSFLEILETEILELLEEAETAAQNSGASDEV